MHTPQTEVILRHGGAELARATLPPGEYIIGREAGVDIHAETPLISRQHARLTINFDHLLLEDLGSSNGTFINEQPVSEATRLFPNQTIRLGPDITLEVRRQRVEPAPDVSLAPAQAAIARHLPEELLAEKRYAIGGIVAQGGMGAILDARQRAIDRTVAMKVMLQSADEADVVRFIDEAKITGQLDHPNIVPIYELGVDEQGQVFYTMKMVRGITLKKVLELLAAGTEATVKKYPLPVLLTIFQKVCDALAFAHAKGVIHRDLKPENIMLGDFGSVLVMDWGLAKIVGGSSQSRADSAKSESPAHVTTARAAEPNAGSTMAGSIMGTPAYMSPEQARGEVETLDARSDIYALGAILFELLHLRPTVTGPSPMAVVEKVARGAVNPMERGDLSPLSDGGSNRGPAGAPLGTKAAINRRTPQSLLAVVRKAMEFNPAARYASVEDLQRDLTAYQSGFATSAENAGAWKQIKLLIKRHKATSIGIAAVLLVGATLGTKAVTEGHRAEREGARATAALNDLKRQAPALRQLAENEASFQRFDAALDKLEAAVALDPDHLPSYWRRAWLLIALERWSDAAATLRLAQQKDPANASRAAILPLLDRLASARSDAERWIPGTADHLFAHLRRMGASGEIGPLVARLNLGKGDQVPLVRARLDGWLPPGKRGNVSRDEAGRLAVRLDRYVAAIDTLEPLRNLPIESLNISKAKVSDLEPLRGMALQSLDAGGTEVASLVPLAGMPLRSLSIKRTLVTDLSPLRGCPLEKIECSECKVRTLNQLAGAPLREVLAESCGLSDIEFLRSSPIEFLDVSRNQITSLAPLTGTPLRSLQISENQIADLAPLRGMSIVGLDLHGNKSLQDLTPLLELPKLERLTVSKVGKLIEPLRAHPSLKTITYGDQPPRPAAEFWAVYDAEQKGAAK